ncbi:MAG: molybdate ABC transporter substrate-binding protein [Nitrospira sp.]|nr:molybdate ABC transporter substrate-binding protein [Nitrospira sp.]HMZ56407.1 molybdate ABC transporter substrate-binding protein [Nitrospira sp.]HNK15673.1 molybdate ABC transporter substrate-binding protein [Nitrospira sp.]HNL90500.1 molybdate ABC transporter substrate-binding protein [Nitrospira sp.]HNN43820.1 molybdate ABC transporter substrate-binding protein [Nitrospira sp.]
MSTAFRVRGIIALVSLLSGVGWNSLPAHAQSETLTIAAANSLKDALRKVLPRFEAEHRDVNLRVIYGPSQSLRKQIEEGAPVDIFLPSLLEEIDQLEDKGLIIQGTKRTFAATSLVLITGTTLPAPVSSIQDLQTTPIHRIAVGDPKTSSVGKVAAQFLKYSKLEQKLKSHYILGEHSRAVLDLVAKGEAEIGVVYRTDAISNAGVRILDTAPVASHTPIRYGVAAAWTAQNISAAGDFIEFLLSHTIQTMLQDFGFDHVFPEAGVLQREEVKP